MISLTDIASKIKENRKYWIAFTGDSITSCEWVHPNWREIVEYVLKEESVKDGDWQTPSWGIRAFNFAYDGATTADILNKVNGINLVKPDLVISVMGGNDPAFKLSVEEHVANTQKIFEKLDTQIVWCTSTPAGGGSKNDEYRPYAEAIMRLPQSDKVQIIDMFTLYQQYPLERFFTFKSEENPVEGLKAGDPDYQHPNALGNAYIAKIILKEVFGVEFDPEKYIADTLSGEKFPGY